MGGPDGSAQFKVRTKKLGLRVIRLTEALPKSTTAETIGRQLIRSAISVGADYRAAERETKDWPNRIGIAAGAAFSLFRRETMGRIGRRTALADGCGTRGRESRGDEFSCRYRGFGDARRRCTQPVGKIAFAALLPRCAGGASQPADGRHAHSVAC